MKKRAQKQSLSPKKTTSSNCNIPHECVICQNQISFDSVLFHCECIVVICQECAMLQVASQKSTFTLGVSCPYCRIQSHNIQNAAQIQAEENSLIDSAFNHFKIRGSRSNEGLKRALTLMIGSGIKGSITIEDLNIEEFSRSEYLPALKLELARLEHIRKNQKKHSDYNSLPLPLGPLVGLRFTRNMILERAIQTVEPHKLLSKDSVTLQSSSSSSSSSSLDRPIVSTSPKVKMCDRSTQTRDSVFVKLASESSTSGGGVEGIRKRDKNDQGPKLSKKQRLLASAASDTLTVLGDKVPIKSQSISKPSPSSSSSNYNTTAGSQQKLMTSSSTSTDVALADLKPPTHPSYFINNKLKKFCVCQRPASQDQYIRCVVGAGKCNGWVHPPCCMDLAFKSQVDIMAIDQAGYICFLCTHLLSSHNKRKYKVKGTDTGESNSNNLLKCSNSNIKMNNSSVNENEEADSPHEDNNQMNSFSSSSSTQESDIDQLYSRYVGPKSNSNSDETPSVTTTTAAVPITTVEDIKNKQLFDLNSGAESLRKKIAANTAVAMNKEKDSMNSSNIATLGYSSTSGRDVYMLNDNSHNNIDSVTGRIKNNSSMYVSNNSDSNSNNNNNNSHNFSDGINSTYNSNDNSSLNPSNNYSPLLASSSMNSTLSKNNITSGTGSSTFVHNKLQQPQQPKQWATNSSQSTTYNDYANFSDKQRQAFKKNVNNNTVNNNSNNNISNNNNTQTFHDYVKVSEFKRLTQVDKNSKSINTTNNNNTNNFKDSGSNINNNSSYNNVNNNAPKPQLSSLSSSSLLPGLIVSATNPNYTNNNIINNNINASSSSSSSSSSAASFAIKSHQTPWVQRMGMVTQNPLQAQKDDEILQWMISTVQTLPILVNRTLPGKEIPVNVLRATLKTASRMLWKESVHNNKASELTRRLAGLEQRVDELDASATELFVKADNEFKHLTETTDEAIYSRIKIEHTYHELFDVLNGRYLSLGLKNSLLKTCVQTFLWCIKVHDTVIQHIKNYSINLNTAASETITAISVPSASVRIDLYQTLLREGSNMESSANEVIKAFSEASIAALAPPPVTGSSKSNNSNNVKEGGENKTNQQNEGEETKEKEQKEEGEEEVNTDVIRAEFGEILCFELIEFWRQKLIMIVLETSQQQQLQQSSKK